jgi:hypothetical protein
MVDAVSIMSLQTRSAVRAFLATALTDLTGGSARPRLPLDLTDLATGSDREVVDSCRLLDQFCGTGSAKSADTVLARSIRDLFAQALSRMKQLPPDPRVPIPVPPPAAIEGALATRVRRKQL